MLKHADLSSRLAADADDTIFKLGILMEELQIAAEELQLQNDVFSTALENVAAEHKRYQDLFQLAPEAYLVTNTSGVIQEANRKAAEMLGVPIEFLVGKPLSLFVGDDLTTFRTEINQQRYRNQFQEREVRLKSRSGRIFDVTCSVTTIRGQDGNPSSFSWVFRDITEQKRLEGLKHNGHQSENDSTALFQHYPVHYYRSGDLILLQPGSLWYVLQGLVKLTTLTEQNKEVMIGLLGSGMPFGPHMTALPIYEAVAVSDVELISVAWTEVYASPALSHLLLAKISQRLRQTELLLALSGERRVETRLRRLLQVLKEEVGHPIEQGICLRVRLTHADLASACCTTRVTISRLMSKLQRQNKIKLDDQKHIIVMPDLNLEFS
ncbi:MAG: hypothetical protein Kow00121_07170 [Elainellaceae cyanobacterium]